MQAGVPDLEGARAAFLAHHLPSEDAPNDHYWKVNVFLLIEYLVEWRADSSSHIRWTMPSCSSGMMA